MIQLIYVSSATRHFTLRELKVMLSTGRIRNKARGITGIIVYHEGQFLQILEGREAVVESLFEKISKDPRHHHVKLLLRAEFTEHNFADSSMGLCNTDAKDAKRFPGLIEFLKVTHPFENEDERTRSILFKFREGAWHNRHK